MIAVDQDGHPALVTNTLGAGKTLLSAYPLEHYLAACPAVFDKPEDTHRIYAAFRDWAGVKPAFTVDRPEVEAASLAGDRRGYVVLVNHSPEEQTVTLTSGDPRARAGENRRRRAERDPVGGRKLENEDWRL